MDFVLTRPNFTIFLKVVVKMDEREPQRGLLTARLPGDEVLPKPRRPLLLPPQATHYLQTGSQEARKGLLLTYKACLGAGPSSSSEQLIIYNIIFRAW